MLREPRSALGSISEHESLNDVVAEWQKGGCPSSERKYRYWWGTGSLLHKCCFQTSGVYTPYALHLGLLGQVDHVTFWQDIWQYIPTSFPIAFILAWLKSWRIISKNPHAEAASMNGEDKLPGSYKRSSNNSQAHSLYNCQLALLEMVRDVIGCISSLKARIQKIQAYIQHRLLRLRKLNFLEPATKFFVRKWFHVT